MEIAPRELPSRRAGGEICKQRQLSNESEVSHSPLPETAIADWPQALCNASSKRAGSNGNAFRKLVGRIGESTGSWRMFCLVYWGGDDWVIGAAAYGSFHCFHPSFPDFQIWSTRDYYCEGEGSGFFVIKFSFNSAEDEWNILVFKNRYKNASNKFYNRLFI
jgi:hypothetical protein